MAIFRELKRRKVLHTLSLYVVGCWVALQVVEVLSDAGLPPGTMRRLLVLMSIGFPFVLVISWFYDISSDGIRKTAPLPSASGLPNLNLGDFALMAGLVAVIALNIYVLSFPPLVTGDSEVTLDQRTLAVLSFNDIDLGANDESIGDVLASELRTELTQFPALRVLGPETSRIIKVAGDEYDIATELGVTSILTGDTQLKDGNLTLRARLLALPAGNIVWQSEFQDTSSRAVELQKSVAHAVLEAIIPSANAQTSHAPRIEAGECSEVYELYLRGMQHVRQKNYPRALELLKEAVSIDENCAIAWEAIAVTSVDYTMEGFAKAGAAARRALELNESLPNAWAVLAEIAEEEQRWNEAEELFLRALYFDPTDAHVNTYYGETLLARGRVREALHYSLQAYRHEPASHNVNLHVALAARYLNDAETAIKHSLIVGDLYPDSFFNGEEELAEGYLILGEVDKALSIWAGQGDIVADWYPQCVKSREQPELRKGLRDKMQDAVDGLEDADFRDRRARLQSWHVIRCATWIGEADMVIDFVSDNDLPTEAQFFVFFQADSGVLRQTPYFRTKVVETGLLDYWRKWGWSDFCRPDGDSFQCD